MKQYMNFSLCSLIHKQGLAEDSFGVCAKDINKRQLIFGAVCLMFQASFLDHSSFYIFDSSHYNKGIRIYFMNFIIHLADLKPCDYCINNILIICVSLFAKTTSSFINGNATTKFVDDHFFYFFIVR